MSRLLVVRHAEATGQACDAQLTDVGRTQAKELSAFIQQFFRVSRIFCSPFVRTSATICPLAMNTGASITIDERLQECYHTDGQETAEEGLERILEALGDIRDSSKGEGFDILISHGDLIGLLLAHLNPTAYEGCNGDKLSRPDIYMLDFSQVTCSISRLWTDSGPIAIADRPSARAILLDSTKTHIFLFELDDKSLIGRSTHKRLWITPGGGVDEGESLSTALQRELFEELGLRPADYTVLGHLWFSKKPMVWQGRPRMFIDNYFVVQLGADSKAAFNFAHQTEDERKVLKQFRWWPLADLAKSSERIIPDQLRGLSSINLVELPPTSFIDEKI